MIGCRNRGDLYPASSETRSGTEKNNYGWEEKLHYVGIPLKVNRNIWSNKRFEVYARQVER